MTLSDEQIKAIVEAGTPERLYEHKRVLVLTPDGTRSCPLPMMVRVIGEAIGGKAAKLDFMVALGTHPILSERAILGLYGISARDRRERFRRSDFFCHRWDLPETFRRLSDYIGREEEGILYVDRAGETLYRLEQEG